MLVIMRAYAYGIELVEACHMTPEEASHYLPEYRDSILVGTGKSIELPHVSWEDLPQYPGPYSFPGCGNMAWEITADEWSAYLALEQERAEAEAKKRIEEEIEGLELAKAAAEAQVDLPSAEEAARRVRNWINVQNEGGEGYVPHIYSKEEYARICARLAELRG